MTQLQDYQFLMDWELPDVAPLQTDEKEPLGQGSGPSPERLLAAAVGNCLCASLLFALRKFKGNPQPIKAVVTGSLSRNERNRLRIDGMNVEIQLADAADVLPHLERALSQFEDFCVVTESVRNGIPISVQVRDGNGVVIKSDTEAQSG